MILAKVLGTVVSTRKDAGLSGLKLLLAREVDAKFEPAGNSVVAVDAVGPARARSCSSRPAPRRA